MRDELRRHQSLGSEEPQTKFNETPFDAVFEVQDELGSGQFAVVRKVVKKATGEEFAAKFIKKRRYATSRRGVTRANIEREVAVLRSVGGHSNVIELHEVYETPSDVILVLELVSGGELFDHVCARECLDEVEAAAFVGQILLGIKHLHSLHIVHLDIKPENVMLKRRGDAQVKLIDFGLSRLIPPGHTVKDMVGTPEFVAPEVVNYEPLSPATDMWALGVVTYILLSGGSPFLGDTRDETFCNITGVNYHFTDRYFKNTSSCAKDFISRLFVRDVQLRATVHDCLRHPWIRGPDGGDVDLRKSSCIAISHIHSFKQRQRWRKAVELVLACNRVTRSIRLACRQSTKMRSQIESRYDPNDLLTSSLLIAAESGSVRELNELSVARGFPNLRNKQNETAAHVAAGAGQMEALSFLTVKGAQLSMEDERGEIPLHWAARSGHANIVAVLANERVNVNAVNKDGESSLLIAARYGHVDVVHVLLDRGASTTLQDQLGDTPLHSAASHGHCRLLRLLSSPKQSLLLKNQKSRLLDDFDLNTLDEFSWRPASVLQPQGSRRRTDGPGSIRQHGRIHGGGRLSASVGSARRLPLDAGEREHLGRRPALRAATPRQPCTGALPSPLCSHLRSILIDRGCDFTTSSSSRLGLVVPSTSASSAVNIYSSYRRAMVTSEGYGDDSSTAATPQVSDMVSLKTKAVVDSDCDNKLQRSHQTHRSSTPCTTSDDDSSSGDEADEDVPTPSSFHGVLPGSVMAAYLADPVVNPAAQSLYAMSTSVFPNDYESPRPRAADQVLTLRQPPHLVEEKTRSCYYSAATPSTSHFISLVTDFDASLTHPSCCMDEETALHCAAARGHLECVQALLDSGSPVNELDNHRRTPLLCALENGHLDIALLLIHKGSKINESDERANTPLHVASKLGLVSAVQTLCHCGADVDEVNQDSFTPLHLAAKEGFLDIVRVLCLARSNVSRKTKDGLTAEILALASEHTHVASLLSKIKADSVRENYISQLCPLNGPLRRIKLKLFGHSQTGKSRLIQSLHSTRGITSTIIDAVSRRISDHYSPTNTMNKDDGIHSSQSSSFSSESNNNSSEQCVHLVQCPAHAAYTRGIDVQNITCSGCGEFSVWEFGGYEPYHMAYDHFVGNTDCIHVVLFRASDSTEEQYKQVLYWMNFLKGRVTPTEPIGHCGIISRRSKVVIVGTNASPSLFPTKNSEGEYESSDTEAMLKTVRLRFETHFDIYDKLLLLDSTNPACAGMKALKNYLKETRNTIISRLQKPIGLLDATMPYLQSMRKQHANFPVVSWPTFASIVRTDVNPLTGDAHCRQLIQQLQLIGEVVYLRDETAEMDYVVLNPEWLGTHIIGQLLSAEFLARCRVNGIYSLEQFAPIFPEIPEPTDLLRMLDVLQLCAPAEPDSEEMFEFPAFILLNQPADAWIRNKSTYVYGGVRVHPMRGMERSLQSTFPRIQVALRRSMHDFQDPMDADLIQWAGCSKMSSGQMEALIRIRGDAVEVQVRGPAERATSCFYFLEDVVNLVEQTASEVAPGIGLERHFLSPKGLQEHNKNPASFPPEAMMAMQQQESLSVKGTHDEEELFTDVVCFGSREVARLLTLGIDVGVADLSITTRCELAALLDPPDGMGRDWSILAVKLHLTDQVPEVDFTGQSLSRTDQLLAEWAIQQPEHATVGRLCEILAELGRSDARDTLYRTVPLYLFAPLDDTVNPPDCGDSGVVSSCHSTGNPRTSSIS